MVKPGDNVEIIGVVKQRWDPFGHQQEGKNTVELVLKAHNVTVQNSETCNVVDAEEAAEEFSNYWSRPENLDVAGRNKLIASFCSELAGLYIPKLGELGARINIYFLQNNMFSHKIFIKYTKKIQICPRKLPNFCLTEPRSLGDGGGWRGGEEAE